VVRRSRTGAGDRPAGGRAQVSQCVVDARLSLQVKYNATPSRPASPPKIGCPNLYACLLIRCEIYSLSENDKSVQERIRRMRKICPDFLRRNVRPQAILN
jgi:hypothetical protein